MEDGFLLFKVVKVNAGHDIVAMGGFINSQHTLIRLISPMGAETMKLWEWKASSVPTILYQTHLANREATPPWGSYATFPLRISSWNKGVKLKQFVALQLVGRTDRHTSLKRRCCLSTGAPHILGLKRKPIKIVAFKGSAQNDESGGRSSGTKSPNNSVKVSYVSHEGEETTTRPPEIQKAPISYTSEREDTIPGSPAIQNLFKKWLMMLRTQSPSQATDEIFVEGPPQMEISESQNESQKQEANGILKAAWCHFLGLDATIKIPPLIFIPWYLAINVVYGAEVSKELTPLWIFGPLIVALYIQILRGICALYVFSFKQTVKVVTNLPTYFLLTYNYVAQGKLKEYLRDLLWQPVVDIRNLDYKELTRRKLKALEEWALEKYLDYVESIWPYYCRTIRFLKKANLI
ncbi:hypothetical protein HHK36_029600 [Tetracentron sinense]|uniref:Uncharacterized protein n=1 Tax=Tetracentron sinense TaxID=13715 RepID=A0A834Y9W4_TETSI|nr:hypothetical protein HHK36_029600 [Tetracentron sinense]